MNGNEISTAKIHAENRKKKVRCSGEKVALALRATINMASSIRLSKWQSILSHMQSIDVLTR